MIFAIYFFYDCIEFSDSLHALSVFQNISNTSKILLDVAKDGKITEDEYPDMVKVLEVVKELETAAQNLKVWAKKNL